jgi:hypothetical protein
MGVDMAAQKATSSVTAKITSASMSIQSKIEQVGKAIGTELTKNRESEKVLIQNQNQETQKMLAGFGVGQQEMYKQKNFGPQSRLDSLCTGIEMGGRLQNGKITEKKVAQKLGEDIQKYNKRWTSIDAIQKFNMQKDPLKINSAALIPANKTMTNEQIKDAQALSEMITNPIPETQISDDQKETMPGKKYEVVQKFKQARLIIPQIVFNKNIAAHSPSMPLGGQATKMYQAMGGKGTPPEVVDGKISPYAMLNLMVDSRFANPNWYASLGAKNEVALMREMLAMDAVKMEMQRRQLELTQLMTLMIAQDTSDQLAKDYKPALNDLYKKTITTDMVN